MKNNGFSVLQKTGGFRTMNFKAVLLVFLIAFSGFASAQGASTNLQMDVMQTEPVPLQAGEYADVWIRVTNTGDATAQNPQFEVVNEFPFQATDRSEWNVTGGLAPGESYDIRVQIKVSENAVFGENDLKIRKTGNGETYITESIPLEVRTDDRSLIVSDLEFPERVEPGSSSEMILELGNMANSHFRNIDVSLNVAELPIAPEETSRKRISSIGPNSSEEVSFNLDVDPDAENQLYQLPIQIDYQNQAGQELSVTETTGVNVGGYPNIDVQIEESDIRTEGRGSVTFRIVNKGEGQARFTELKVENTDQYEVLSEDSVYLGSMIADDYQTAEFELYVGNDSTDLSIPVNVSYRDGEGQKSVEKEVTRQLYSSSELERYGESGSGNNMAVLLVALVVTGGAVYYWRRRR